MDIKIYPGRLSGTVRIPSSKSVSHRNIIAAALSGGISRISGISLSKDIEVTSEAMRSFGADISRKDDVFTVKGIFNEKRIPVTAFCDCGESGSTLRFIIPVAAALGIDTVFDGHGKLPERPITPYIREFEKKGILFDKRGGLPIRMTGKLQNGIFELEGDISSQFITGLLFALPLLDGDSEIHMLSPLQSAPYAELTLNTLKKAGICVQKTEKGFFVKGVQSYAPFDSGTEGDYSQAAFFIAANAAGSDISIAGLDPDSAQGDKVFADIASDPCRKGFTVDVSDIPDLVPALAVLGSIFEGKSRIVNAERLRIKESDRIESTAAMIRSLGGKASTSEDSITIEHIDSFKGGTVDACNDHRIVMAAAVAAVYSSAPVIIKGAEAVRKSYPNFFEDLAKLGAKTEPIG
ncbi:MAG: 3-phosphoshikimate 1-carboxyvinyltransferase [Oscillospiraceae bacterium]|nr:3-phosphoshikimate 1-carboxyvinyltransferase [Oscillospiraceae bacterium]